MTIELLPRGDMTAMELARFRAGRDDWADDRWQDHCGDPDCEICDDDALAIVGRLL